MSNNMRSRIKVRETRRLSSGVDKLKNARKEAEAESNELESEVETYSTGAKDCVSDNLSVATVTPDPTNSRDFPVIKPHGEAAFLAAQAEKVPYVILDKGVLINKTPVDHHLYEHIESQINDIKKLAGQIKAGGGLYQQVEVYRTGGINYRIIYGHRRFYSIIYSIGWEGIWSFRVHRKSPTHPKLRQFVENNSRSDLALHEQVRAFSQAYTEAKKLNNEITNPELINILGISKSYFYKLKKIIEIPLLVKSIEVGVGLINHRIIEAIFKQSEIEVENGNFKNLENAVLPLLVEIFKSNGREVPSFLSHVIIPAKEPNMVKSDKVTKKKIYSTPKVTSTNVIKKLLTSDITKLKVDGVDWKTIDWDDAKTVNKCLAQTIKYLEEFTTDK
ncbi:hypothetical protein HC000_18075 [Pseudoalteromonas sp. MIP2626]|uniref:hypothetical protein n=1 Tax=Pseudoalteromonas TaxID=53246 RepID=UPI0015CDA5E0|nr:hypothetical protein [Pseudoalteromonas sp. MIP2626]NYR14323.1 hypothetical protein [Pseudoalteromonas sp. MIP2626]|tara:strand:- start:96 stop:1262 length:1167 start_codon:yes stop_codon:yes gene_type:complete